MERIEDHPLKHHQDILQHVPTAAMQLYNYVLQIQPAAHVQTTMMQLKQQFAETFSCATALHSLPNISLLRFVQHQKYETLLVNKLQHILQQLTPFQLVIDGFGSLPTHTIFAKVQTQNVLADCIKALKPLQAFTKLDKWNKAHFIDQPFITIAYQLQPWQYEKAWLQYQHTPCKAAFMVHEVVLLKRFWNATQYTQVATFALQQKPLSVPQQASLF